jgi:hypothetical protein
MQLADFLPCIRGSLSSNLLRSFFWWDVRAVLATIDVFLLLNVDRCRLRLRFFLAERVIQFSTRSVRALLLRLRFKVDALPKLPIINNVAYCAESENRTLGHPTRFRRGSRRKAGWGLGYACYTWGLREAANSLLVTCL